MVFYHAPQFAIVHFAASARRRVGIFFSQLQGQWCVRYCGLLPCPPQESYATEAFVNANVQRWREMA